VNADISLLGYFCSQVSNYLILHSGKYTFSEKDQTYI